MKATGKNYIRCIRRESNEWPRYKLWLLNFIQIDCFLLLQAEAPTWAIMSCSEVGCTTTGSRVLFGTALDFTVSL